MTDFSKWSRKNLEAVAWELLQMVVMEKDFKDSGPLIKPGYYWGHALNNDGEHLKKDPEIVYLTKNNTLMFMGQVGTLDYNPVWFHLVERIPFESENTTTPTDQPSKRSVREDLDSLRKTFEEREKSFDKKNKEDKTEEIHFDGGPEYF